MRTISSALESFGRTSSSASGGAATRWLLFEVKGGTGRGVADYARDATLDLLAYRRNFDLALAEQADPYGIGYAWGAGLAPNADSEIALCTPDTLSDALELLFPTSSIESLTSPDPLRC